MTRLFYEPDALVSYECQADWEFDINPRAFTVEVPARPDAGASKRDYRAYNRACLKYDQDPRHQLRRDILDKGYTEYKRLFAAQEQLRSQEYGLSVICDAFSRLPKLRSIVMSLSGYPVPYTSYLRNKFKAGLRCPCGDLDHGLPAGVPQLYSLLRASHEGGRQLTRLVIGDISWRFLQDVTKCKNMAKHSLRQIRTLDLCISPDNDLNEYEDGSEGVECREYLANSALCDFIKAAPDLESLSIAFDGNTRARGTELKYIIGDHHWPKLKRVKFEDIDATHADFASFCTRHASTLKHLGLSAIRLLEQGEWPQTLDIIQKTLNLESADIQRFLYGDDPPQTWPLGDQGSHNDHDEIAQGNSTSAALSKYLVHGGSCPLLDEKNHPNYAWV